MGSLASQDQSQLELVVVGRGWVGRLGWGAGRHPDLLAVLREDELHFRAWGVVERG